MPKAKKAEKAIVVPTSETKLMDSLMRLSDAGAAIIQIRTREPIRCAVSLRRHLIIGEQVPYKEWDVVNGMREFDKNTIQRHTLSGTEFGSFYEALLHPLTQLRTPTSPVNTDSQRVHHFVYVDPHPFMGNNPMVAELIQQYAAILPPTNVCLILITNEAALPDIPVGLVLTIDFETPTPGELRQTIVRTLEQSKTQEFPEGVEVSEEEIDQIVNLGSGMTLHEFDTYSAISAVKAGQQGKPQLTAEPFMEGISQGKTEVVKQSEILSLSHPDDIDNVGGMGRLKKWLKQRRGCYSEDAREFGIEPPKGMVLVGVPGTGKSLTAKVTASVLGVPLIRMDFARVFSKYVGDSESRVQAALKMVETMSPCVLFVDEVDKALGGAEGGGDSGTSSRVLGSYLTWLQECKAPVFSVVTANRVEGLPPELLRHGRFDKIWSLGLPSAPDRREALAIHLRKRGRDIASFTEEDLARFDEKSEGYVPAEIESAVRDAIVAAFVDKKAEDVTMDHLIGALDEMVPLSRSNKAKIDRMIEWAKNNATPVHEEEVVQEPQVVRPRARQLRKGL